MTKTQEAHQVYERERDASQEKYVAVIRAEFPKGTRVMYSVHFGKPGKEFEVVEPPAYDWSHDVKVRNVESGAVREVAAHFLTLK